MLLKLFKRLRFKRAEGVSKEMGTKLVDIAKTAIVAGEEGIEQKYIHGPEAEATAKIATAVKELLSSLVGIDSAAIRAGSLLVVKVTVNGKVMVASETMSPSVRAIFEKNPDLLRNPDELFTKLKTLSAVTSRLRETNPEKELPSVE